MHARVTTVPVEPGRMEDAVRILRNSVAPVMKQQTGFKGWFLLTESKQNKITSITLWETATDLMASQMNGEYQVQIAKLSDFVAGPPATEQYEVSAQA